MDTCPGWVWGRRRKRIRPGERAVLWLWDCETFVS